MRPGAPGTAPRPVVLVVAESQHARYVRYEVDGSSPGDRYR